MSITSSFTAAILYDRYHKRKAQQKWCRVVSHLAQEPLAATQMPRTITVFLSAPPGDGLRAAREHFHEYVKPVLVAGALDWEVIEGRKEGEVRASLAAKIRRLRRRNGEKGKTEDEVQTVEDRLEEFRRGAQVRGWDGLQGDLILGRHTWKEYIRGLHEGWLGPLDGPHNHEAPPSDAITTATSPQIKEASSSQAEPSSLVASSEGRFDPVSSNETGELTPEVPSDPSSASEELAEKPPSKPSPASPYLLPVNYPTSPLSNTIPARLPPSMALPFPHLLGFLNTPIRVYRFLTRRYLTDHTGQLVATLVLASNTRDYRLEKEFVSSASLDEDASPSSETSGVVETKTAWEQESVLADEEAEWHKSARAPNGEDSPDLERPWQENMTIDDRVGTRMRTFELPDEEKDQRLLRADEEMRVEAREQVGQLQRLLIWFGLRKEGGLKGWEMGEVD